MSSDVLRAQRSTPSDGHERGALICLSTLRAELRRQFERVVGRRLARTDVGLKIPNVRVPSPIAVLAIVDVDERVGEPQFSI